MPFELRKGSGLPSESGQNTITTGFQGIIKGSRCSDLGQTLHLDAVTGSTTQTQL